MMARWRPWVAARTRILTRWLSSDRCFYVTLGLLVFQAAWLALSARYPMAFDENFHFGLIQLHATQWLPFFTTQPPHAAQFGPVVRDPSYLYHFLLSLPYRLIAAITANQTAQIIVLRFINIGLTVWEFVLARRLLLRLGGSRALVHASLLLICLVPIVPFLAAQINYDNLFIPVVILSLLLAFTWLDNLRKRKVDVIATINLLSLLFLGSLVKYPFLPVAAGIGLMALYQLWRLRQHRHVIWANLLKNMQRSNKWLLTLATVGLVIAGGLFAERYMVNLVRYHSLSPSCERVLSVQECLNYAPWARDYTYAQDKLNDDPSKLAYLWQWPFGLWFRSFFAISDTYDTQNPLPLPGGAAIALAALGLILLIRYGKRLLAGNVYRQLVVVTLLLYLTALFVETFRAYIKTGEPVAINGRYLLPFLPVIFLLVGLAYRELWRGEKAIKGVAVTATILLFVLGGGMLAFIIRSQDTWYWPNPTVVKANHTVRKVLKKVVPGGG